jgi:hypothetical protein
VIAVSEIFPEAGMPFGRRILMNGRGKYVLKFPKQAPGGGKGRQPLGKIYSTLGFYFITHQADK